MHRDLAGETGVRPTREGRVGRRGKEVAWLGFEAGWRAQMI